MKIGLAGISSWEETFPWLAHGFTSRAGGVSKAYTTGTAEAAPGELNLGYTAEDTPDAVAANRRALLQAFAPGVDDLVMLRQVHGREIKRVERGAAAAMMDGGRAVCEGDGLVTGAAGVLLGVMVADCVPVLLADTRLRRVAALHAGWRGTAAGIVERGLRGMLDAGSRAEDMVAAIGPSIGACCYSVGAEVRDRFGENFAYADALFGERDDVTVLDLWEANRRQLLAGGMRPERVTVVGECTACTRVEGRRKYFSHRAEAGRTGRAMGVIGVRV